MDRKILLDNPEIKEKLLREGKIPLDKQPKFNATTLLGSSAKNVNRNSNGDSPVIRPFNRTSGSSGSSIEPIRFKTNDDDDITNTRNSSYWCDDEVDDDESIRSLLSSDEDEEDDGLYPSSICNSEDETFTRLNSIDESSPILGEDSPLVLGSDHHNDSSRSSRSTNRSKNSVNSVNRYSIDTDKYSKKESFRSEESTSQRNSLNDGDIRLSIVNKTKTLPNIVTEEVTTLPSPLTQTKSENDIPLTHNDVSLVNTNQSAYPTTPPGSKSPIILSEDDVPEYQHRRRLTMNFSEEAAKDELGEHVDVLPLSVAEEVPTIDVLTASKSIIDDILNEEKNETVTSPINPYQTLSDDDANGFHSSSSYISEDTNWTRQRLLSDMSNDIPSDSAQRDSTVSKANFQDTSSSLGSKSSLLNLSPLNRLDQPKRQYVSETTFSGKSDDILLSPINNKINRDFIKTHFLRDQYASLVEYIFLISAPPGKFLEELKTHDNIDNISPEIVFSLNNTSGARSIRSSSNVNSTSNMKTPLESCVTQFIPHGNLRASKMTDFANAESRLNFQKSIVRRGKNTFCFTVTGASLQNKIDDEYVDGDGRSFGKIGANDIVYGASVTCAEYIPFEMYIDNNNTSMSTVYETKTTYVVISRFPFIDVLFEIILGIIRHRQAFLTGILTNFENRLSTSSEKGISIATSPHILNTWFPRSLSRSNWLSAILHKMVLPIDPVTSSCFISEVFIQIDHKHSIVILDRHRLSPDCKIPLTSPNREVLTMFYKISSNIEYEQFKNLSRFSADLFWSTMNSIDDFLFILTNLLLEKKLFLSGVPPGFTSMWLIYIYSILFPFRWMHPFLPICPELVSKHIVEAPTPVIAGICSPDGFEGNTSSGVILQLLGTGFTWTCQFVNHNSTSIEKFSKEIKIPTVSKQFKKIAPRLLKQIRADSETALSSGGKRVSAGLSAVSVSSCCSSFGVSSIGLETLSVEATSIVQNLAFLINQEVTSIANENSADQVKDYKFLLSKLKTNLAQRYSHTSSEKAFLTEFAETSLCRDLIERSLDL